MTLNFRCIAILPQEVYAILKHRLSQQSKITFKSICHEKKKKEIEKAISQTGGAALRAINHCCFLCLHTCDYVVIMSFQPKSPRNIIVSLDQFFLIVDVSVNNSTTCSKLIKKLWDLNSLNIYGM